VEQAQAGPLPGGEQRGACHGDTGLHREVSSARTEETRLIAGSCWPHVRRS
jgi:hypothetical protein